jgi:hypothetical protein
MKQPPEAQIQENVQKAKEAAEGLYPHEKWEVLEAGIFIAKSRMPRSAEQINVLEKELRQARILVERGSAVYLLPEVYGRWRNVIKRQGPKQRMFF